MLYYTVPGLSENPSSYSLEPWMLLGGVFCLPYLSAGVLGCLVLWGFLRCCWVSDEFLDYWCWAASGWLIGSPLILCVALARTKLNLEGEAIGCGHRKGEHTSTQSSQVSPWLRQFLFVILLPCPSHFGIMIAKAPKDPLVLSMALTDSFQPPSLPDHVCPGSGGSLCPYSWDGPVRKDFWRMSLATDVVQASTICLAHSTVKGLARNSYQVASKS